MITSCRSVTALVLFASLCLATLAPGAFAGSGSPPPNATAKSYGSGWVCDRGYRESKGACVVITVPANALATQTSYGRGWECRYGYLESKGVCTQVLVPANAFLAASGVRWECERGFRQVDQACEAIQVPRNAFLTESSFGDGWQCLRGFHPSEDDCRPIDLPQNAHLDYSGNDWECDRPYERQQGRCVLP